MSSGIEWCDEVWNPVTGCEKGLPCWTHCWARRMAENRLRGRCGYDADEPFRPTVHWEKINKLTPLQKSKRVFACSMADLFCKGVPDKWREWVFAQIAICQQHTVILLTKRPKKAYEYLTKGSWKNNDARNRGEQVDCAKQHIFLTACHILEEARNGRNKRWWDVAQEWAGWPLPNLWLGISASNQTEVDERVPWLLKIPAAKRVLCLEPLLGPVDLSGWLGFAGTRRMGDGLEYQWAGERPDWVIVGGESGPGARPMHPDWARNVRDQCQEAGVPFFFKQWGEWQVGGTDSDPGEAVMTDPHIHDPNALKDGHGGWAADNPTAMARVGKKLAGRELDGRTWDQVPPRESDE